ncbi:MAG: acetolactate synthase [Myxococcales bacterium]|nr:acetolactate synthase [Myxococcales bacterium]
MAHAHGGKLVALGLARHGTTHLFTLCGGHIQAIYDGCLDVGIRVVDTRHEQTAGHAADGYARVTGRPGVCAVTAGPGVTDVVTAVANAQRAGIPMIVLGGAGPNLLRDMGSLQDMDHLSLMRSITKYCASVPSTDRLQEYIDTAFRIAMSNVPGPVFLEVPLDVLMGFADDAAPPTHPSCARPRPAADPALIEAAAAILDSAERPTFIVGGQVRWSPRNAALATFADAIEAPFFLNGMARGGLPRAHPGLMTRARKAALAQTDVCFVFGTPLDFRLSYGRAINPNAKLVQVDLDGQEPGRNRRVDVAIHGDTGIVLDQLLSATKRREFGSWRSTIRGIDDASRLQMAAEMTATESPPNPLRVCAEIDARLGPNDIVIGDGGDFVASAAYVLRLEWPQLWMDPGPLGTLGVGPGYAMAAKLARPDARVWLIFGDGSFGLHALEFEAMARQGISVVSVIGNDAAWTQIRRGQIDMYGRDRAIATGLDYTRYERVVEAVGGFGRWVDEAHDVGPALDEAMASGKPSCVNVKIASSDFRKGSISV